MKTKPRMRKVRRVKAWLILVDGELIDTSDVYDTKQIANSEAQDAFDWNPGCRYAIAPCTITYREPTKPKGRGRK